MSKEAYAARLEPPRPPDDGLDAIDRARIKSAHQAARKYELRKPKLQKLYPHWNLHREKPSP